MEKSFKNILIIGHSNIGDVCYDLVIIHPLKKAFPNAKISYLTSSRSENIPRNWKGIDEVIVYNKKDDKKLFGRLPFMFGLQQKRFDVVIALKSTLMQYFLGIPEIWTLKSFLKGKKLSQINKHVIDIYLDFLSTKGVTNREAVFNLQFDQQTTDFRDRFLKENNIGEKDKVIGILPTAAWTLKSWPIRQWNELAKTLKEKYGYKTIALGKKMDDHPFGKLVMENMSPDIISAMDQTSLVEALALIKRCNAFIGPDSSLLHLASCMRVETIGVYGATDKNYIYPYFHRQNIVASTSKVPCMPCYPRGNTYCHYVSAAHCGQCMEEITVKEVLDMIEKKLSLT